MNTAHIHLGLARNSDWAFTSAVVIMVVALLLLAFELAYARSRKAESELVSAGSVAGSNDRLAPASGGTPTPGHRGPHRRRSEDSVTPGVVTDTPRRPFDERVGRAGLILVYAGIGC